MERACSIEQLAGVVAWPLAASTASALAVFAPELESVLAFGLAGLDLAADFVEGHLLGPESLRDPVLAVQPIRATPAVASHQAIPEVVAGLSFGSVSPFAPAPLDLQPERLVASAVSLLARWVEEARVGTGPVGRGT